MDERKQKPGRLEKINRLGPKLQKWISSGFLGGVVALVTYSLFAENQDSAKYFANLALGGYPGATYLFLRSEGRLFRNPVPNES